MENTRESLDTDSGCFDTTRSLLESGSNIGESTPILHKASRKRKASYAESFPSPPHTPQFSSTLNESLLNLEKFHLQNESFSGHQTNGACRAIMESDEIDEHAPFYKISKGIDCKFKSAPNTPQKQISSNKGYSRKANTNSFIKNFSQISVLAQSPLNKEAYDILYPDIPPLESLKTVTPQKIRDRLDKASGPAKKCLFSTRRDLFRKIVTNPIVMEHILKELSNGDLYRLSQVSKSLENAILCDVEASTRFKVYMKAFHTHKENYKITPPSSPEKDEEETGSASPSTKNHQEYWEMASELNKYQHLIKCPMCTKASIVEHSIAYCQAVSCGYIHCRKCNSFAYNPKDFKDKCNNIHSRSLLGDLSNSTSSGYITDTTGSFFSSPSFVLNVSNKSDISGVFSECENSTPRQKVKRNLSVSFAGSAKKKSEIFGTNNRMVTPTQPKTHRRTSLVPSIPIDSSQKSTEKIEPASSPPRTKQYAACSKQSKRNLKRLTH